MHNPTQSKTILGITPSRRATGAALVDKLGLVDVDLLNLHDIKGTGQLMATCREWLSRLLRDCRPDVVVLEDVDVRRLNPDTQVILDAFHHVLKQNHSGRILKANRKRALETLVPAHRRNQRRQLRLLANRLAVQSAVLAFHQPPKTPFRCDWDRSWGQTVAACALGLAAKSKLLIKTPCLNTYSFVHPAVNHVSWR